MSFIHRSKSKYWPASRVAIANPAKYPCWSNTLVSQRDKRMVMDFCQYRRRSISCGWYSFSRRVISFPVTPEWCWLLTVDGWLLRVNSQPSTVNSNLLFGLTDLILDAILGASYSGVLSSDDYSAYNGYPVKAQQKCLAHLHCNCWRANIEPFNPCSTIFGRPPHR